MRTPLLALVTLVAAALPAGAAGPDPYRAGLWRWRAGDGTLAAWERNGTLAGPGGTLVLDHPRATPGSDTAGAYHGRNFYNGGAYLVGTATGPLVETGFAFTEAIPSWNATTPPGTWVEVYVRARVGGRLTNFANLGVWASDTSTVERHSVAGQEDTDQLVATDTLKLKAPADAVQMHVRLFSANAATPTLTLTAVAVSAKPVAPGGPSAGNPASWGRVIPVPTCTQQAYPDGGEAWCSPTSTSMVLGFWAGDTGPCEPRVRAAVAGTFDWVYDGHGNWPFNAAYAATAATSGGVALESVVTRMTSLAEAEPWIAAGVPVVVSYSWREGTLANAPVRSSAGHLGVLVGFDANGDPILNDPAAPTDAEVRRTYRRGEFEAAWVGHSGGAAYLIFPRGHPGP